MSEDGHQTIVEDDLDDEDSPQEKIMAAGRKILQAGIWLIRNGYGRMMLLPYAAPSGCYWRCAFYPPGHPSKKLYHYSTSSVAKYLADHCGGSIRSDVAPAGLAKAIMKSVPKDLKASCVGEASLESLQWLELLERSLAEGFLPQAFHEYTDDYSRWDLVSLARGNGRSIEPQPGYVPPHEERDVADDPEWRDGEAAWTEAAGGLTAMLQIATLADDNACYEISDRLRRAMSEADGFSAMRLLRSTIGSLVFPEGDSIRAKAQVP